MPRDIPSYLGEQGLFPKRLSSLMKERKVSQQDLASAVDVQRQTISNYKQGKSSPDWETLCKIAHFFDVSADYLIDETTNDLHRTPSAVDDLGLSNEAVKSIRAIRNDTITGKLPEGCFEALDQFLKSEQLPAFLAFFSHAQTIARKTREMLEKAIIEQDNPSNERNIGYDTYRALLNQEQYPFARYTVGQSFSEMIDTFCNAAEIDRLHKQLSKRIDENAAETMEQAEEDHNGNDQED